MQTMNTMNTVDLDEKRVENAALHGISMMDDFWKLSKAEIAAKVANLTTPDLIDLMLFITQMAADNQPDNSDEQRKAIFMHMTARHFIYEPSAFDDCALLEPRLPLFRAVTTDYLFPLANASIDERAGMALRFIGFSADTVAAVIKAHEEGDSDGIVEALSRDPACQTLQASMTAISDDEWDRYAADYLQNYVVDPTQQKGFSPLPCGKEPLLPPHLGDEDASFWVLQYFIRAYADSLNIIQKRYGYFRRQQLLAAVVHVTDLHIESGHTVDEIPGLLGRLVLDWEEMCQYDLDNIE